jgi:hypothetical protein
MEESLPSQPSEFGRNELPKTSITKRETSLQKRDPSHFKTVDKSISIMNPFNNCKTLEMSLDD